MFQKIFKKIKSIVSALLIAFGKILLDDSKRDLFMFKVVNTALGIVSAVMTVVNIITKFRLLMWSTLIFAVACFINLGLSFLGDKGYKIAKLLFKIEFIGLFTLFIVTGEPEGFSPFWAPLLPACGIMLFGFTEGILLDLTMLVITIFFCWIPFGQNLLMFEYTDSFLLRFPLLYIGYMCVGVILSLIFSNAQTAYHNLSNHDNLTGALNRTGFIEYLNSISDTYDTLGFMILDLDFFKRVNDTYGHLIGDEVLCYALDKIQSCCPGSPVCRWGGEEFAILLNCGFTTENVANSIIKAMDSDNFVTNAGIHIHQTISCGAVEMRKDDFDKDKAALEADNCLYEAKETGRNKAVFKSLVNS